MVEYVRMVAAASKGIFANPQLEKSRFPSIAFKDRKGTKGTKGRNEGKEGKKERKKT